MPLLARATGNVLSLTNNCCCKLIVNCAKVKSYRRQFVNISVNKPHSCHTRFLSTAVPVTSRKSNPYIVYDELLQQRRSEASRSIIVQIQTDNLCEEVYAYCSLFGRIKNIFHYTTLVFERSQKKNNHHVLIEFEDRKNVDAVLSASTHANYDQIMPTCTTMLWFRSNKNSVSKIKLPASEQMKIQRNSCKILSKAEIKKKLVEAGSISEQMIVLYDSIKLTDAATRLRFFTAHQIEQCFKNLFPNLAVLPFGSSVNSFGKQGCDLDLSLSLDQNSVEKANSSLVYQTKYFSSKEKIHVKRMMETMAEFMKVFLPGISNINKILQARVPIIKFEHLLCGLECDLSTTNMTAYYMSELLYMYGEMDWRVRPLNFTIRTWAGTSGITNKSPGSWITNFSLTLMVIFFLQQKKIVPSINDLQSKASREDVRVADGYVDCTFLRDITILPKTKNTDSLEKLLLDFFVYYSNFDFGAKGISLRLGKPIIKPENHSIYINNPLEPVFNVSKNVNADQLSRLMMNIHNAAYSLENAKENYSKSKGLIDLFAFEKS